MASSSDPSEPEAPDPESSEAEPSEPKAEPEAEAEAEAESESEPEPEPESEPEAEPEAEPEPEPEPTLEPGLSDPYAQPILAPAEPGEEEVQPALDPKESSKQAVALVVIGILLVWTYVYNAIAKGQGLVESFFSLLDTLSEDMLLDSLVTFVVGLSIVAVFSATKLYTHVISNPHAFRIIEIICMEELPKKQWKRWFLRITGIPEEPEPAEVYPMHVGSVFLFFSGIYLMSWVYVVLFSEALFFVSWSAGVDLPITAQNLQLLPTLALAIPFSARVMAYLHYPYAQDYADFMPAAAFVLLLVASLGFLFESTDQKFFLLQVFDNPDFLRDFMRHGLLLAFVPVFSEGVFWLFSIYSPSPKHSGEARLERTASGRLVEIGGLQRLEVEVGSEERQAALDEQARGKVVKAGMALFFITGILTGAYVQVVWTVGTFELGSFTEVQFGALTVVANAVSTLFLAVVFWTCRKGECLADVGLGTWFMWAAMAYGVGCLLPALVF